MSSSGHKGIVALLEAHCNTAGQRRHTLETMSMLVLANGVYALCMASVRQWLRDNFFVNKYLLWVISIHDVCRVGILPRRKILCPQAVQLLVNLSVMLPSICLCGVTTIILGIMGPLPPYHLLNSLYARFVRHSMNFWM